MWKLVFFSLLVLTSALFAAQDVAQPTAEESRILTLENAWNQAIQQKDGAALLMLLGPELVYIEYDGRLMNKAEYLADAQQPSLHPARVVGESLSVHVYARLRWRSEFAAKRPQERQAVLASHALHRYLGTQERTLDMRCQPVHSAGPVTIWQ